MLRDPGVTAGLVPSCPSTHQTATTSIHGAPAARLTACRTDGGVDTAERTSHSRVHRQRLERCLCTLQSVLTAGAFRRIAGVACGPAASSAMVIAETAISAGNSAG